MRFHGLKLNSLKCALGVKAGNLLGFLVHLRGIVVDTNKANTIVMVDPSTNMKQL